jgi:hypothetical protein
MSDAQEMLERFRDRGWEERDIQAFLQEYPEYLAGLSLVVGEHPLLWEAWARRGDCRSYLLTLRALRDPEEPMSPVERWVTAALSGETASDTDALTIAATVKDIPGLAAEAVAAIMSDARDWERWVNRMLPPERASAIETVLRAGSSDPENARRVLQRIAAVGGWTPAVAAREEVQALIDATLSSSSALADVIHDGVVTVKMIAALPYHPDIVEAALERIGAAWDHLSEQERVAVQRTATRQAPWALALARARGHDRALMQAALGNAPSDDDLNAYVAAVAKSRPNPAQIEMAAGDLPRLTPAMGTVLGGTARFWFETLNLRDPKRVVSAIRAAEEGGFDRWRAFTDVLVKIVSADASAAAEAIRFFGPDARLMETVHADPSVWPVALHAINGWARRIGDSDAHDQAHAVRAAFVHRAMNDPSIAEPSRTAVLMTASQYDALTGDAIALIMRATDDPPATALALIQNLRPFWDRLDEATRNHLVEAAIMTLETIPSTVEAVGAHPALIAAMERFVEEGKKSGSTDWMMAYAHVLKALVDGGAWRTMDRTQRKALLSPLLDSGSGIEAALFCAPDDPLTLAAIQNWPRRIAAPTSLWAQRLVESNPDAVTDELRHAIAAAAPPVKPLVLATARFLGGCRALVPHIGQFFAAYVQSAAESPFFDDALGNDAPTHLELDIRRRQVRRHGLNLLAMLDRQGYDRDIQIGFAAGHPALAAEYLIRHPDTLHDPLALSVLRLSVNAPPVIDIEALDDEAYARWVRLIGVTGQGILGAMRFNACPGPLSGALPATLIMEAERSGLSCDPFVRAIWNARLAEDPNVLLEYAQMFGPKSWIETTLRTNNPRLLERYWTIVDAYRRQDGDQQNDRTKERPIDRLRKILSGL